MEERALRLTSGSPLVAEAALLGLALFKQAVAACPAYPAELRGSAAASALESYGRLGAAGRAALGRCLSMPKGRLSG